jgi:choline-sulfatase
MNLLFLMSDQHNRRFAGCYGHPIVKTPNLDRLAARGVRFDNAYCTSPICVPARASLATGRYVHQIGAWDNAFPYTGTFPSWGHRLTAHGYRVTTIGKLHYRSPSDDTGFPDQRLPMHVSEGVGDLFSLIRDRTVPRPELGALLNRAGPGVSSYTRYDEAIAELARSFLRAAASERDRPWALLVSFASPHHPLIAPSEYLAMYPSSSVIYPTDYALDERPTHPVLQELRRGLGIDSELDPTAVRRAVAAYYALCSFMDAQIGKVLSALDEAGLTDDTLVFYTADHGDTVGEHGLWWKHTMYEGSAGVPLLMAGPGVDGGRAIATNVSHVDCYPTILEAMQVTPDRMDADLPGRSLLQIAREPHAHERVVFGEYHAIGSITGYFMIRDDRYKYVEYVGYEPQLFDLRSDPGERQDLGEDDRYVTIRAECRAQLRAICDPVAVSNAAIAAQQELLARHGGPDAILREGFKISYTPAPDIGATRNP